MNDPLASRIRPQELSQVVGQRHLLAPGKPLYNMIESGNIPNLIFYGPFGHGQNHCGVNYCKAHKSHVV